jgi:hypothetical protein
MRKVLSVVIAFLLVGFKPTIEDISESFYRKITEKYLQKNVLSYNYQVIQYDTTGVKELKTIDGVINQSANKFSYELGNMKVIFQDSFYMMIYTERKEIYYHIVSDSFMKKNSGFDVTSFVNQLKANNVKVIKDNACKYKNLDCYNLVYGILDKDLYKIKVDKKTGYIDQLRIDYYGRDEKNYIQNYILEIHYSNYKQMESSQFYPLDEFVFMNKTELILKEKYKNYTIKKF